MNEEIVNQKRIIDAAQARIVAIQNMCQHFLFKSKYGSSTGGFDPDTNMWWVEVHCLDCGKYMQFDSDANPLEYRKYSPTRCKL